jgi:glycosyltransferase involved in cell wall biosynthesis
MSNKMKGLFFLYHYSSKGTASSIQNIRFVKGLKNNNLDFDIVGTSDSDNDAIKVSSKKLSKVVAVLRRLFPDITHLPDFDRFLWAKRVKKEIATKVDLSDYQWIHTTGQPHSTHLIGLELKEKTGLPWVAQFYDPWVDNKFRIFKSKFLKRKDSNLERKIALNADLILHTNQIIFNKWVKRYGKGIESKMAVLPLMTDENLEIPENNLDKTKFTFLHAGGLYGPRTATSFIKALTILKEKGRTDLISKFRFTQIGYADPSESKMVERMGFSSNFKFIGRQPFSEVLNEVSKSDALLLIDNPEEENPFFPSKLCEYFSYNKPILGIVPNKSVAGELLIDSGHFTAHPDETENIAKAIVEMMEKTESKYSFDKEYFNNFLPTTVASNYINIVKNLVNKRHENRG